MIAIASPPVSIEVHDQIWRATQAGVTAANERRRPITIAFGVTPPAEIDPLDIFAAASDTDERFFWEQPSRGIAAVALGAAAALEYCGESRFTDAAAQTRQLFADLVRVDGDRSPVRLVGGFAFDPDSRDAGAWRAFPSGSLTLPAMLYRHERGDSSLTVCRRILPDADAEATASALERSITSAFDVGSIERAAGGRPRIVRRQDAPTAADWKETVAAAVAEVRADRLQKVVLARTLAIEADRPLADAAIADRLRTANPSATTFVAARGGVRFVGATPELLVRLRNRSLETVALAGSIGRGDGAAADLALARQLLDSAKDRIEHEVVVQTILGALSPLCVDLRRAAGTPRVERSRSVQHLATPIAGTLAPSCTALDLVGRLHPTPAVGGAPRQEALAFIREREGIERGWYAGPVGWLDANGDAEFVVALRSGLISGAEATLFAGCGIVAASDPEAEYRETALKFGPMLDALGLA